MLMDIAPAGDDFRLDVLRRLVDSLIDGRRCE
jgi:hypothetical protein